MKLPKRMVLDRALAIVETRLITVHEAHIDKLDILLVISQFEAETRELQGLLGLSSPDR